MRRMVVVPCFAIVLVLATIFKDSINDTFSSVSSSTIMHKTITVVVEQPQTLLNEPEPAAGNAEVTYNNLSPSKNGRENGVEAPRKPTRQHLFRANGLMEVNADGRHPLFELIERGETKWQAKQKRQSKTLEEAVREYKRRHKRLPPKGFDHWCVIL